MPRLRFRLVPPAITLSLLCLMAGISCHRAPSTIEEAPVTLIGPGKLRVSPEARANLKFEVAKVIDFPDILSLMGKISATEDRTTVVPARVSGRIETVMITSGEIVKTGQPLATLFSPDFISAREEYLQSIKQAATPNSDLGNLSSLAKKRLEVMGLSAKDIEALNHADTASAETLNTTQASLIVRAPRSGAIILKNATVGSQVNAGDTLFTIADLSKVWFLGDLYPEDLDKVKRDQEIFIDAVPGTPALHGKVSFISPMIDPTARTIKIRALMENPNMGLRADMYVQGKLILSSKKALVVPSRAVLRERDSDFVFVRVGKTALPTEPCEIARMKVKVGNEGDGYTSILEGISDGDEVVSEGSLLLSAVLANSAS